MDLVDGPQDSHLVTGPVEPVVAAVQSQGRRYPGGGGVPREGNQAVVLVDVYIEAQHRGLRQQANGRHEEARGYAGHTDNMDVYIYIYCSAEQT